jgi:predicted secreted Zn-dependent protease
MQILHWGAAFMLGKTLSPIVMLCCLSLPSHAGVKNFTKYTGYSIAGTSALELLRAMDRLGPKSGGASGYAVTYLNEVPSGRTIRTAHSCAVPDYDYHFTIKLPHLRNAQGLSGKTGTAWANFLRFVKVHEETHRTIWMACIAEYSRAVKNTGGTNCASVNSAAASLWQKMRAACLRTHAAFDAAERKRLLRLPLVVMAKSTP